MMKWLTFFFAVFILLISVLADLGKLGFLRMLTSHNLDKVGHFVLYGILTLLLDLTLLRSRPYQSRQLIVVQCGLILAFMIGLEEFSQQFFDHRTFSLLDLAAGYLGVALFSWLALKIK